MLKIKKTKVDYTEPSKPLAASLDSLQPGVYMHSSGRYDSPRFIVLGDGGIIYAGDDGEAKKCNRMLWGGKSDTYVPVNESITLEFSNE